MELNKQGLFVELETGRRPEIARIVSLSMNARTWHDISNAELI